MWRPSNHVAGNCPVAGVDSDSADFQTAPLRHGLLMHSELHRPGYVVICSPGRIGKSMQKRSPFMASRCYSPGRVETTSLSSTNSKPRMDLCPAAKARSEFYFGSPTVDAC